MPIEPSEPSRKLKKPFATVPDTPWACLTRLSNWEFDRCNGPSRNQVSMSFNPLEIELTSFGPSLMDEDTTEYRINTLAAAIVNSAKIIARTLGRNLW